MDIPALQRKAQRYTFEDGVFELHNAFWLLATGLYALVVWGMPNLHAPLIAFARWHGTAWTVLVTFIVPIVVPMLIARWGQHIVDTVVRPRWLRRTDGLVHAKPWASPRWVLASGYGVVLAVALGGVALALNTGNQRWLLVGLYVGVGFGCAWMFGVNGARLGLPRYAVLALVGALGTVVVAWLPVPTGWVPALISFWWAALLTVSGARAMAITARAQRRWEVADDAA